MLVLHLNIFLLQVQYQTMFMEKLFIQRYFGDYVEEIEILTPDKGLMKCSKTNNSELFFAVISGLGAFGIILNAKIKLRKIKSSNLNTDIIYVKSIDEAVEKSENLLKDYEFNIGSLNFTKFNKKITDGKIYSSNFLGNENLKINSSEANLLIYFVNLALMINKFPVA